MMFDGSTITGAFSSNNMIITNDSGVILYEISSNGEYFFPIGDGTYYSPVTLNFTSGSYSDAYLSASVTNDKHPNNTSTTDYLQRYWSVGQDGISGFNCDVVFTYDDTDIQGTEENIYGAYYTGSSWEMIGQVNAGANTISGTMTEFGDISGVEETIILIPQINTENIISAYSFEDKIYISSDFEISNGHINIYNLIGQKIIQRSFKNNQVNEIILNGNSNCYLINIVGDNINYSKTVFVE